jgi:CubicO group peptidase (beta-lactamase class C family)
MKHLIIFCSLLSTLFLACNTTKSLVDQPTEIAQPVIAPLVKVEPPSHSFDLDRLKRLDRFLETEISENKIPGSVLLIHQKGEEVYSKSFGPKKIGSELGMPKDEIFYIQSMTKPIISIAFMMLFEEGYFQLGDPISKYLPEFKTMSVATSVNGDYNPVEAKTPITIKHALTHTGGMLHGLSGTDLANEVFQKLYMSGPKSIEERVKILASLPLMGQPGEQWFYSASPDILARLIEVFTGQSPDKFLKERIFDPLGMTDTGYNISAGNEGRKAVLYSKNEDGTLSLGQRQTPATGHTVFGGTHGLFSTAKDYMKFCDMLLNNGKANGKQLIGRKTLELMTMDHLGDIPFSPGNGFGLGFGIVTDIAKNEKLATKGTYYWSGAFNTYFYIDPEEEVSAVLMMQFEPYDNVYSDKLRHFITQAISN